MSIHNWVSPVKACQKSSLLRPKLPKSCKSPATFNTNVYTRYTISIFASRNHHPTGERGEVYVRFGCLLVWANKSRSCTYYVWYKTQHYIMSVLILYFWTFAFFTNREKGWLIFNTCIENPKTIKCRHIKWLSLKKIPSALT